MMIRVHAQATEPPAWDLWFPAWRIDSREVERVAVGDRIRSAVSFLAAGWRTSSRQSAVVESVGPGVYAVAGAPIARFETEGTVFWRIDLPGLTVVTEGWRNNDDVSRAMALIDGDRVEGEFELSVDPTISLVEQALTVEEVRVMTAPWIEFLPGAYRRDPSRAQWRSVGSADYQLIHELDPQVLLRCRLAE